MQVCLSEPNLSGKFGAAINDSHNVLQIMAPEKIILSSPVKRFQFGREKIRGSDKADLKVADLNPFGIFESRGVPAIAEAKNRSIGRHQVKNQLSAQPATNRYAFYLRLTKPQLSQPGFQSRELHIGRDRNNRVYIESRPNRGGGGIGQQQPGGAASDERDLIQQRSQLLSGA